MAFSVNTNNEAMTALRLLNQTSRGLSSTQERINSGFKVNGAKDNASTFAIAQGMRGDIASFRAVSESLALGQATVNVAMTAATNISDKLNQIKDKVTQAQGSNVDRVAIQNDIRTLVATVESISQSAQFNGVNLLNNVDDDLKVLGSLNRADPSSAPTADYVTVAKQNLTSTGLGISGIDITSKTVELKFDETFISAAAGDIDGQTLEFKVNVAGGGTKTFTFEFVDDMANTGTTAAENIAVAYDAGMGSGSLLASLSAALKDQGFSASYNSGGNLVVTHSQGFAANVTSTSPVTGFVSGTATGGDPSAGMGQIENAINSVKTALAALGTGANRLEAQKDFIDSLKDSLTAGVGTLVDADLAEESAKLQALQTKQQLGIQALSIANQQPGSVLSLFR